MEEQAPELPQPVPEISKEKLWLTLGFPPVITSLFAVLLFFKMGNGGGAAGLLLSIFVLVGLFPCTTAFSLVVGTRYRGVSQAFLVVSYLLGQIIVCFSLWIGILLLSSR